MKLSILALFLAIPLFGQSCPSTPANCPAFQESTISIGLTPITLPSLGQTLAGAQTDTVFNLTTNNQLGATALISNSSYIGPRVNRILPSVSSWLQNHTALSGSQFQCGLTFSAGIVEASKKQWGGDGGFFCNYAPSGTSAWAVAFQGGAAYLPGITNADGGHAKWIPKIAIGPQFKF